MASIGDCKVIVISLTVIVIIGINSYFVDAARKGSKRTKASKEDTEKEIRARIDEFVKSWNDNDMAGVAAISAKNGQLLGQGIPTLDGRRDIYSGLIEAKKSLDKIYITINDVFPINKKFAYHTESWKAFDRAGRMLLGNGRSLVVWKKIGDVWYIMRHMFNDSGILHGHGK